jgi:hypothetical protein
MTNEGGRLNATESTAKGLPEGRDDEEEREAAGAVVVVVGDAGVGTTALVSLDKLNCEKASSFKKGFGFAFPLPPPPPTAPAEGEIDATGLDGLEDCCWCSKTGTVALIVLEVTANGLFIGGGTIGAGGRKGSATVD